MALNRLHGHAGLSGPSLSAYAQRHVFAYDLLTPATVKANKMENGCLWKQKNIQKKNNQSFCFTETLHMTDM